MSGKAILDTNVVIAVFAEEGAVLRRVQGAGEVFVPAVVLGELYFGARKSAHPGENVARIRVFASQAKILNTDAETAEAYGRVRHALRQKGRPLPENDVWIAALSIQHGITLVTRDEHFDHVEGIRVERW